MSKLIHAIWLWVMLVAATCGPCATFAYDYYGEIRPNYDGCHESAITYDGVPAHINGEEKDGMTGEHLLLATFAKFLAAETAGIDSVRAAYKALGIETSSTTTAASRVYTIYQQDGTLFKFGEQVSVLTIDTSDGFIRFTQ